MRSADVIRRAFPLLAAPCLLLAHVPAHAALRSPQVVVNGSGLQWYLDGVGENINVQTDQQEVQVIQPVNSKPGAVYQFEAAPKGPGLELGIYDAHLASPELVPVFPTSSGPGWFALVTFRSSPDRAVIYLFDVGAHLISTQTHLGMPDLGFGFYLRGPDGTFYTQDARNPGGVAQALFYYGTGIHSSGWWICFESTPTGDSDWDFVDAVLFIQLSIGVPVSTTSWGELKARFR